MPDTLVARLQTQFEIDPKLKEKCISSCISAVKNNKANRLFDDFPPLVSKDDCAFFIDEYQKLLISGTKATVHALQKRLIKIACEELLDVNGKLKQELIALLGLQVHVSLIDNYQAVCAFVGMMNIYMTSESSLLVKDNQNTYLAMTKLINNSYGERIRESMRENKIAYDSKYDSNSIKLDNLHPLFFLSLFAGGLIGVGIYGAVKVGQEIYNEYKPLSLPEAPIL